MMQNIIKYSGLRDLSEEERVALKSIVEKEYPKIQRMIKNVSDLTIDIKTMKKDTRKRYMLSCRLEAPTIKFTVKTKDTEKGGDWDITKATHKALEALQFEIKHRLRTDTESWRKGGLKLLFRKFS